MAVDPRIIDNEEQGFLALPFTIEETAGVKFNDADLLGIPIRSTISPRTLEKNSVEIKWRSEKESQLLPLEGAVARLRELITRREN